MVDRIDQCHPHGAQALRPAVSSAVADQEMGAGPSARIVGLGLTDIGIGPAIVAAETRLPPPAPSRKRVQACFQSRIFCRAGPRVVDDGIEAAPDRSWGTPLQVRQCRVDTRLIPLICHAITIMRAVCYAVFLERIGPDGEVG